MSDPNRKTQRSFYCRDNLWDLFEVMARDLGCSMDYLLNEAMRHYAHSRNYGLDNAAHHAPPPQPAPPQPAAPPPVAPPPPQAVAPPPPAANPQSGFIRAAAPPMLGNPNDPYSRGFEHRTFERLPAAAPPPAPHVPAMTAQMGAIPPPPPQAPPLSGTYNAAGAPSSGQFMAAHLTSGQFPPAPRLPVPRLRPSPLLRRRLRPKPSRHPCPPASSTSTTTATSPRCPPRPSRSATQSPQPHLSRPPRPVNPSSFRSSLTASVTPSPKTSLLLVAPAKSPT